MRVSTLVAVGVLSIACCRAAIAEETPADAASDTEVLPGHSLHGEFLNEGPRQRAYRMSGTGRVRFPVTTSDDAARAFIEQGVGQLYGFWYLEAERSFRQAASLDPKCAMAWWGAALATARDDKRCKGFLAKAVELKDGVTERERMYIEALDAYVKAGTSKKKERADKYIEALEKIAIEFPDDLEAKAFLALQMYKDRRAGNHLAIDALLGQVFEVEPLHPAHHFRIHLWDSKKAERALGSAALCGQAAPDIAHMWHMPGHIYSKLKRYDDASWQQEASARVDHAHMMRDRVMPDRIHNFAHNNEWLIRNLNHVGRVRDAVDLARNMIELPRHPKYNTLKKGSARYGRLRLFETLSRYELWEEMIALLHSPWLDPTDDFKERVKWERHLGMAYYRSGDVEQGDARLADLRRQIAKETEARDKAVEKAVEKATEAATPKAAAEDAEKKPQGDADNDAESEVDEQADEKTDAKATEKGTEKGTDDTDNTDDTDDTDNAADAADAADTPDPKQRPQDDAKIKKAAKDAAKPFASKIADLEKAASLLEGYQAAARDDFEAALPLLKKAGGVDPMYLALVEHRAGRTDAAVKAARAHVDRRKNQVQPLACLVQLLWEADRPDEAGEALEELRAISSSIDHASPVFDRIGPIAASLGYCEDWAVPLPPSDDLGERPDLDALGPYRWSPSPAADWELPVADGATRSLKSYAGKPVIVIFYLGFGCLHCAEQLQTFGPMTEKFNDAGIELVAVSTDGPGELQRSVDDYKGEKLPIPLVSGGDLTVFKDYRCFDDFEGQPLHGTFLIDARGMVLWQDIGFEPFMDAKFLLAESKRLLAQQRGEARE